MSGGVDSTVAAYLLREQGYTVRGVHLLLWHGQDINPVAAAALERVRLAADQLGIPLEVLDWQQKFRASVIEPYVRDLKAGLTPNPCITCNRAIKWGALLDYVQRQGASWLASGHYARLKKDARGLVSLWRGKDPAKDQSYFLSGLKQEVFQHMVFPLAEYTKQQTRQMARSLDLPDFEGLESQDLCFLGPGGQEAFLRDYAPELLAPGLIVDSSGKQLGEHAGLPLYTIGQRKNIRVAAPRPYYVLAKDVVHNRLVVGFQDELPRHKLLGTDINWISGTTPDLARPYAVKIRSAAAPVISSFQVLGNGDIIAQLQKPLRDITAGQRMVIYDGDECLGSALIIDHPANNNWED